MRFLTLKTKLDSDYSTAAVIDAATKDARKDPPIPPWDSPQHAPFIRGLKNDAENCLADLAQDWSEHEAPLLTQIAHAEAEQQHCEVEEKKSEKQLEAIENEFKKDRGQEPPAGHKHNKIFYWILLIFLALCEVPINTSVFQVFGDNQIFTIICALVVGAVLATAAHIFGAQMRQGGLFKDKKRLCLLVFLIVIPALLILAIGFIREWYIATNGEVHDGKSLQAVWVAFTALNYTIFFIAMALSYFYNDALLEKVMHARKMGNGAARNTLAAKDAVAKAKHAHDAEKKKYQHQAEQIVNETAGRKNKYEEVNLRERNDSPPYIPGQDPNSVLPQPKSFLKGLGIDVPELLRPQ